MKTGKPTYVLDTNVFLTFPDLLNRDLPGARLVVPSAVHEEVAGTAHRQPRFAALVAAITGAPERFEIRHDGPSLVRTYNGRMKGGDAAILFVAKQLSNEGAAPVLVTEDRDLIRAATASGLAAATSVVLRNFSASRPIAASELALLY